MVEKPLDRLVEESKRLGGFFKSRQDYEECVKTVESLKSQLESKSAERKQNKPTFDIEVGREPVFALDGDHDVANYRLVSDIYETQKEVLLAKKNLENIMKLYEDNTEFFEELQKKIDKWEQIQSQHTNLVKAIQDRKDNILPKKIQRIKDAIFTKGLVNDENQKKQIIELDGMRKALEWEIEELQNLLEVSKGNESTKEESNAD